MFTSSLPELDFVLDALLELVCSMNEMKKNSFLF
jgi:hypothetical protein